MRPAIQLALPLGPGVVGLLNLPRPLTQAEWDQMLRVLEAMRPALLGPQESNLQPPD